MTIIFVFLLIASLVVIGCDEYEQQITFLAGFTGTTIMIYVSKKIGPRIGRTLSRQFLAGPSFGDPLSKPRALAKWTDQLWQLAIHIVASLWEFSVLLEDWALWTNPERSLEPARFNAQLNPPPGEGAHPPYPSHTTRIILRLYMVQLGVWIATCFSHRFLEPLRRKDYVLMYAHHLVTILLVLGSHVRGFHEIGIAVLFVHDISDIPVDLIKMMNYCSLTDKKAFFMGEITFVGALIVWAYMRMYILPFRIIHTIITVPYYSFCLGVPPDNLQSSLSPPWCVDENLPPLYGVNRSVDWVALSSHGNSIGQVDYGSKGSHECIRSPRHSVD
eukprot:gb/GEZN01005680.1/.p1 GENE.gb/GEZN01005680.1/~~gb/GEZN01005680.1/.p1  ORF type:complete len:388 (+),score=36.46 gb/GEZN01005680.1/:174-1166(+)